jgi:quinol monooxygenase YgiN
LSTVSYLLELTIEPGKLEEFNSLATGFISSVNQNEPGTLGYLWHMAEDNKKALLLETFTDSDALLTHLGNVGPTLPNLLALAPITRFEVLGAVNDAVREALAPFGAVHFPNVEGFERR